MSRRRNKVWVGCLAGAGLGALLLQPLAFAQSVGSGSVGAGGVASELVVGGTAILSGTNARILYDNSGILGEYSLTGTGATAVMQTAPALIAPTATSLAVGGLALPTSAELSVGAAVSRTGTGTVSNSASGTTVTGVGTTFKADFTRGASITVNAETQYVVSIASDTSMTTTTWTGANSGLAYTIPGNGAGVVVYPNGSVEFGGTAPTAGSQWVGFNRTISPTSAYSATITALSINPTIAQTGGAYSGPLIGINSAPLPDVTNTQNWTSTMGQRAFSAFMSIPSGAAGTFTGQSAFYISSWGNASASATLTNAYGYRVPQLSVTGTVTSAAAITIDGGNFATNSTALNITASGANLTIPSGNWDIYSNSGRPWRMSGDIWTSGTAPVPTGTGTPVMATGSTDTAGEVTGGTLATSIIITFAASKVVAPFCVVTPQTQIAAFAYTISTTAITITLTATTGEKVDYHCVQH